MAAVNLSAFGDFVKNRRNAMQPEDVGLPRGPRRRVVGLRREEVSDLCGMSVDYLARIERGAGPAPSEQMTGAIARGLRLSLDERDYLFGLVGYRTPSHSVVSDHITPGLMRIVDRLDDTAAQVFDGLGRTLIQTPGAVTLWGNQTTLTGLSRCAVYRWFCEPGSRSIHPAEDHDMHSEFFVAQLRTAVGRYGSASAAAELADTIAAQSPEFASIWSAHRVGVSHGEYKRFTHPEVGAMSLHCQTLIDPVHGHALLVFTATPGTESYDKLALLNILAHQNMTVG